MEVVNKKWALITGASSGLGVEFAKILAARKYNLVLTARRKEPMEKLAAELEQKHGVEVVVEPLDLSQAGSAAQLIEKLDGKNLAPEVLINNAAFGHGGLFLEQDETRLREMLQLDIVSLTELTYLFARRVKTKGHGYILLVASMAANQPTPMLAAYGAAKAYVLSLGESLHLELAPEVNMTVLSPGLLDTSFAEVSGFKAPEAARISVIPVATAAGIGIDAMFAKKSSVVAGTMNKIMASLVPFVPRNVAAKMAFDMAKK